MIERIGTTARASKIVKHNGVAYLAGQVAEGLTIQQGTNPGQSPKLSEYGLNTHRPV